MRLIIEPCLPTDATRVPVGAQWLHEIKHDGYRLLVRRVGDKVRIYTRRGADWTQRFPAIVQTALRLRAQSIYLDGEGVVCRDDGVAVFDKLHNRANDEAVFLYAFDLLEIDGEDLRGMPLEQRKLRLRNLLARRKSGIVSKRRDMAYRSGRAKSWLKIKNPKSPAMLRVEDGTF